MKKIIFIISLLFSANIDAQTPSSDELVLIHNVVDDAAMNNITPLEGALIYNLTSKRLYKFNGTQWIKIAVTPTVKEVTTSYTLLVSDDSNIITVNSTTDVTLTVPSGLPIGYNVSIYQTGTGRVTIQGSGATVKNRLNRFRTAGIDAGIGIVATNTNIFHITGDLKR